MTTKTTGAEYKAFMACADPKFWPDGAYYDDADVLVNGAPLGDDDRVEDIDDGAEVRLSGGIVYLDPRDHDGPSFETHFKRWRKAQTTTHLVVEVDKAHEQALRDYLDQLTFKVKVTV
jgi:hypothetical protein